MALPFSKMGWIRPSSWSLKPHRSRKLLWIGFVLQVALSAAAIAAGITYSAPPWLYVSSLLIAFLCGAIFVYPYRQKTRTRRVVSLLAYALVSYAAVFVLTLYLFCTLKTCS